MASKSSRTTHVVTIPASEVMQYADVPQSSAIKAVEEVKYATDGPIRALRVTIETPTRWRHRSHTTRWRR